MPADPRGGEGADLEGALIDRLAEARRAYSTGGIDGARSQIKRVFDAYDALLTDARKEAPHDAR